jgi:hypothetical protein
MIFQHLQMICYFLKLFQSLNIGFQSLSSAPGLAAEIESLPEQALPRGCGFNITVV